ncbi:MAG: hypothetical protein U5L96_04005 [Owenweeksia sp.]|nr:hypothetical protein [Owenweeksia sp.]
MVSRQPTGQQVSYARAGDLLKDYPLVINTTPLGTYPATQEIAPLKMDHVSENHLFYDLIYNPGITKFLAQARAMGAQVKNGEDMLQLQAQKAWQIWHDV